MMAFMRRGWNNYLYVPRGTIYTFREATDRIATEMLSTPGSTSYPTNDFPVASTVTRDNVFLGNLLAGSYSSNALGGAIGWSYYHSDHLGTPRLVTGVEGPALLKYWPYGDEVAGNPVTSERLKFATMERDTEGNHFYDHARHHDFNLGRFVSVDKSGGHTANPQSWNRYSYALDNPLKLVDPNGLDPYGFWWATGQAAMATASQVGYMMATPMLHIRMGLDAPTFGTGARHLAIGGLELIGAGGSSVLFRGASQLAMSERFLVGGINTGAGAITGALENRDHPIIGALSWGAGGALQTFLPEKAGPRAFGVFMITLASSTVSTGNPDFKTAGVAAAASVLTQAEGEAGEVSKVGQALMEPANTWTLGLAPSVFGDAIKSATGSCQSTSSGGPCTP